MTWVGDLLKAGIDATGEIIKFQKPIYVGNAEITSGLTVGGDIQNTNGINNDAMNLPALRSQQVSIGYSSFDAVGATNIVDLGVVIPKGSVFMCTLVDDVIKFEGGSVSAVTLKIGDSDGAEGVTDDDRYMAASTLDLFEDADTLDAGAASGTTFHATDAEVALSIATTGGNLDALTAGSITLTFFWLQAREHLA